MNDETFHSFRKIDVRGVSLNFYFSETPIKKLLDCFFCVEVFTSSKERKFHIDSVHQVRPKPQNFICSFCGKIYASADYLKRHIENAHESNQYFCDLCNNQKPIQGKIRLYEHMRYRHIKPPETCNYPCHICGRTFHHLNSRKTHTLRAHTDPKLWPFQCNICPIPKPFVNRQAFKDHQRCHTGEKNFSCQLCGDKFGTRNHLKQHQTSVHETKDVSCDDCGKHFTSERYLKQHRKTHDQSSYLCPVCPLKAFSLTTTLRAHIKTNHPDFPLPPPGTILKNYDWNKAYPIT